jgi:hypothetical protein
MNYSSTEYIVVAKLNSQKEFDWATEDSLVKAMTQLKVATEEGYTCFIVKRHTTEEEILVDTLENVQ